MGNKLSYRHQWEWLEGLVASSTAVDEALLLCSVAVIAGLSSILYIAIPGATAWAHCPWLRLTAATKMSRSIQDASIFHHAKFDLQALLRLAARLRNRPCTCDLSQEPLSGSLNWVINLVFDDEVQWIFRSPRTYYSLDEETVGKLLASEAATLKFIRKNSSIPVPEVFFYRLYIFSYLARSSADIS